MNALVTIDHHFFKTKDGKVWCRTIHNQQFWERYTSVYDKIFVLCRLKENTEYKDVENFLLSSCENVEFLSVPDFTGPIEYIKKNLKIKKEIKQKLSGIGRFIPIFRLPSTLGFLAYDILKKENLDYGVEVVANPITAYAKKNSLFHFFLKKYYTKKLKEACKNAKGVAYVTEFHLQKYFPTTGFSTNYSSIDLDSSFFFKREKFNKEKLTFIHVSNIHSEKKGHRTLLKALGKLNNEGYDFECFIIGNGRKLEEFKQLSIDLHLKEKVFFVGELSEKEEIKSYLKKSDVLVFPSESEGLPRAIIEAMACSLAVISSPVDGIPELINKDFLKDFNNYEEYSKLLKLFSDDRRLLESESLRNFKKAKEYSIDKLSIKRKIFYENLTK